MLSLVKKKTSARDKKFAFETKFFTQKIMQKNNACNNK